jgi:HlyD family secretion protein
MISFFKSVGRRLAILLCILQTILACKSKTDIISPTVRQITESVYASGTVKSTNQYNVYSTVVGRIDSIYAPEGTQVKAGDILMSVKGDASKLNIRKSDFAVNHSDLKNNQAKIETALAAIELARSTVEHDSTLLARQQNLWKQNVGTRIDLDQRELAYKASALNYRNATLKLDDLRRDLQYSSDQARNDLNISKTLAGDYIIRASVSGKVFRVLKEQGELVSTGNPIAVIGDADSFIVELNVDEQDISRVKDGQRTFVTLDSYKGEVFEAKIFSISPMMEEESRSFVVKASFISRPPTLFPNLTVEANILIQSKDEALTIPRMLLISDSAVLLESGELRRVTIGLRDYNWVEIVDGLTKEDKLSSQNP